EAPRASGALASRATPAPAAKAAVVTPGESGVAMPSAPEGVRAGEWDDNANYREFTRYLAGESRLGIHAVDVRDRRFLVVRDAEGKAVPRCPISIKDTRGHSITLTSTASGRAILFPHAEGLSGGELVAEARCQNAAASARFQLAQADGIVDLRMHAKRDLAPV